MQEISKEKFLINPYVQKVNEFKSVYLNFDNARKFKGNWQKVFNNKYPIFLDIGCGNGEFINYYSKLNKNINYIGIELQYKELYRACKKNKTKENVKIIRMNAKDITSVFAENEISSLSILFPDPWPKNKQKKHRLINDNFLFKLKNIMKNKSKIIIKTDNNDYFLNIFKTFFNNKLFNIIDFSRDLYKSNINIPDNYFTSFERIFLSQKLPINYILTQLIK